MTNVTTFGAKGDGQCDDTAAIQEAVHKGEGPLFFPSGTYRLTRPLEIDLGRRGRTAISGAGGCARLLMTGSGPALHLVGTHAGTAGPSTLTAAVLDNERMPIVSDIEIAGAHVEADGIRLEGLWQPNIVHVYVHDCRHGIHVIKRNRNLIISACHVHNNHGVGVFYDHLNLHQSNICGSHISYNKCGGIKVLESEIRNLQISGNDIEYNYNQDAAESADVWIETLSSTVREGTIIGNTIQAVPSPGGANVRFRGHGSDNRGKAGNWAITGNLISSQQVNVHLQYSRGIALSGNSFFSGHERNIRIEQSEFIAFGVNTLDRHPDYRAKTGGGILFDDCRGCTVSGVVVANAAPAGDGDRAGIEVRSSQNITITGTQVLDCEPLGVLLQDSRDCLVSGCTIQDRRTPAAMSEAVREIGGGGNLIANNLAG